MYCAGALALISDSITARQINFSLIVRPPVFWPFSGRFLVLIVVLLPFQLTPPPPNFQNFAGERVQLLFDLGSVFQCAWPAWRDWMRIAARQRKRADGLARLRCNARDHLVDVEFRRPKLGLHPFQRAPRFGV